MNKLFTTLLLLFVAVVASIAQNFTPTVFSSGGNFAFIDDNYSISYTLGECFVKTSYISNTLICEGFQQGELIDGSIPPIDEVNVYPNPLITNTLYVDLPVNGEIDAYTVTVYSMTGQVLYNRSCDDITYGMTHEIDMIKYGRGMYFVKIQSRNGSYFRTFKIEKLY